MKCSGVTMTMLAVAVASILLLGGSAMATQPYYVDDLGTLGGAWTRPHGLNNAGQVVGEAIDASGNCKGFVWTRGVGMQSLGTLGGSESAAYGINDSGTIVGGAYTAAGLWHGFKYTGGTMSDLGTVMDNSYSNAYAINNAGQIAGVCDVSNINRQYSAIRWSSAGVISNLGSLGGILGWAYGINSAGNVAGSFTDTTNYTKGFVYTTSMADIGLLPGGSYCEAHAINDSGTAVGVADAASGYTHAFYRNTGSDLVDMGTLAGGSFSEARGINNSGLIVGRSEISDNNFRGFLYSGSSMLDLNSLTLVGSTATIYDAWAINDAGQIAVDFGPPGDTERAGLLTPATPGDANLDRAVTFKDYIVLEANFGKSNATWSMGDFNGDGTVTFKDYIALEANFGHSAPEPASISLLALAWLSRVLRRK